MDNKTSESISKKCDTADSVVPSTKRRRGRPSFIKVEPVATPVAPATEKPMLPDPRWMAEFVATFLRASR